MRESTPERPDARAMTGDATFTVHVLDLKPHEQDVALIRARLEEETFEMPYYGTITAVVLDGTDADVTFTGAPAETAARMHGRIYHGLPA